MTRSKSITLAAAFAASLGILWACGHDGSLREYLHMSFWLPLAKRARDFQRKGVPRVSAPFAGMQGDKSATPLARLRQDYQSQLATGASAGGVAIQEWKPKLAAARADKSLTAKDREEVDLLEAKVTLRNGSNDDPQPWRDAKRLLQTYLRRARVAAFASEARGWLAHVHYHLGEQSAAGKLYLDELNHPGSNLSAESMVNSLRLTYGFDGGPRLLQQLEDYFDTAEHAAFAIQLATNPRWSADSAWVERPGVEEPALPAAPVPYDRINALLQKHARLFETEKGARVLALLAMRTALRAADPAGALRIAARVPSSSGVLTDPDFLWMQASAHFLTRDYSAAAPPLLAMFASPQSTRPQKAAAAYALCGVYRKTANPVEQLRFALWLQSNVTYDDGDFNGGAKIDDLSVYWAMSGWDLGLILEIEAPLDALQTFLDTYPREKNIALVQYAAAVRLARLGRYQESADWYQMAGAANRVPRMRQLARLSTAVQQAPQGEKKWAAQFQLATYIADNQERLFFNDRLWGGFQRYALFAGTDGRFTAEERNTAIQQERELKDSQEEYWQAYLILKEIVDQAGPSPIARKAAALAASCLSRINTERFGRGDELVQLRRTLATQAGVK